LGGNFRLFTCSPRFGRASLTAGYRFHPARISKPFHSGNNDGQFFYPFTQFKIHIQWIVSIAFTKNPAVIAINGSTNIAAINRFADEHYAIQVNG
jgi:hypothetical protein